MPGVSFFRLSFTSFPAFSRRFPAQGRKFFISLHYQARMLIYEIMTDPTAHRARFPFRGARCLARRARISGWRSSLFTCFRLCFDEPTSALDPGLTHEVTRGVSALWLLQKSRSKRSGACSDLVLVTGIEPVRVLPHGILSPGRLPVPPHQHAGFSVYHEGGHGVNSPLKSLRWISAGA